MTQEEKQLLLKDLCARLPYGVRYKGDCGWPINPYQHTTSLCNILNAEEPLVYLRPMSSMTEEEKTELDKAYDTLFKNLESGMSGFNADAEATAFDVDFYNSHHLDYRGLIPMGLALEAPKDMYTQK